MNKSTTRPESEKRQEHQKACRHHWCRHSRCFYSNLATAQWTSGDVDRRQGSCWRHFLRQCRGPCCLFDCSGHSNLGLIFKAPKMLFSKDGPLFMRWSKFPPVDPIPASLFAPWQYRRCQPHRRWTGAAAAGYGRSARGDGKGHAC